MNFRTQKAIIHRERARARERARKPITRKYREAFRNILKIHIKKNPGTGTGTFTFTKSYV